MRHSPINYPARGIALLALATLLAFAGGHRPQGAGERPVCEICKTAITGEFYTAGEKAYCSQCYARYPHCPGCGAPVRSSGHLHKGEKVCDACAREAGKCGACGDVLLGSFYRAKDDAHVAGFCESCYRNKPRCAICDLPYPGLYAYDGKYVCPRCLEKAERCTTCNQPLLGTFYTIEFVQGKFCRKCFEERAHCDFCNRPILTGGRLLDDGRQTCAACASTAVGSMRQALDLLAETVRFCESDMHMRVGGPYDFVLVDGIEMAFLTGRTDSRVLKELGLFNSRLTPQSPRPTIAILSDLPRTAFLETAAHEYAHLWQHEQNPWLQDKKSVEGFAQWVAAKWLEKNKLESAHARLEASADPIYGLGYHKVQGIEYKHGVEAVFEHVRTTDRNDRTPPAPRSTSTEPLSRVLPAPYTEGDYAFLRDAVVIEPIAPREPSAAK